MVEIILAIVGSVFASSGFWALLQKLTEKKSNSTRLLVGIGHDRIIYLASQYLKRGSITVDEYKNLHDYLFIPYQKMGGNGVAQKLMEEVDKLPIKEKA